ncbi:hypothetical protein JB92DRAFT_3104109 [Gautieria morchelliformis]|nr:hypothetical protein JB92DRAFT_3104109 [Gautieria morchelliformis]
MASSPDKLRVAICGAGIGGLMLALALTPYPDITVDIYEAATKFEEIGAGLAIWGRGVAALKRLGLEETLRSIAPGTNEHSKFELRRADHPSGGQLSGELVLSTNLGLHRAQFINLLVDLLSQTKRATTHFGKRCLAYTERDAEKNHQDGAAKDLIRLQFTDGSSAACDVLVGCDGIKSAVRGQLMRGNQAPLPDASPSPDSSITYPGTRFSGTVAYRALVKPDDLRAVAGEHSAMTVRKMHLVSYPVAGGKFINLIAYCSDPSLQAEWEKGPWVVEVEQEEILHQYRDFEPEVQALIKCAGKSSRWAMYDLEPLQFWSRGRVTILGDAAHAMTPFIGSGGGQVIEDVYVLARLLGSSLATRNTLPSVLRGYEQVRMPRANKVIMCTRESRRALEFQDEYEESSGEDVAQAMTSLTEWLWEGKGDPDDDVQEAKKLIEQFIGGSAPTT